MKLKKYCKNSKKKVLIMIIVFFSTCNKQFIAL